MTKEIEAYEPKKIEPISVKEELQQEVTNKLREIMQTHKNIKDIVEKKRNYKDINNALTRAAEHGVGGIALIFQALLDAKRFLKHVELKQEEEKLHELKQEKIEIQQLASRILAADTKTLAAVLDKANVKDLDTLKQQKETIFRLYEVEKEGVTNKLEAVYKIADTVTNENEELLRNYFINTYKEDFTIWQLKAMQTLKSSGYDIKDFTNTQQAFNRGAELASIYKNAGLVEERTEDLTQKMLNSLEATGNTNDKQQRALQFLLEQATAYGIGREDIAEIREFVEKNIGHKIEAEDIAYVANANRKVLDGELDEIEQIQSFKDARNLYEKEHGKASENVKQKEAQASL